jgi:hypothetical protein
MDRRYGRAHYTSYRVKDDQAGYEGYDLTQLEDGEAQRVARIVFWDAGGRYYVEIFDNTPIPLEILEELIAETKENVKYK